MSEQAFSRTAEQFLHEARRCRGASDVLLDQGTKAMGFSLFGVRDIALALEHRQHRQYRIVGQVVAQARADFGHRRRPTVPEDRHDVELALSERRRDDSS